MNWKVWLNLNLFHCEVVNEALLSSLYLIWSCLLFALTEVGEAFTLEEQDEKEQLLEEVGRERINYY
jgi:hypothetical protein